MIAIIVISVSSLLLLLLLLLSLFSCISAHLYISVNCVIAHYAVESTRN